MVSATGLACAAAIGAAPRTISPIAPADATDWMLAAATDRRTASGRTRSRVSRTRSGQLTPDAAAAAGAAAAVGARARARDPAMARTPLGRIRVGAGATPPPAPHP